MKDVKAKIDGDFVSITWEDGEDSKELLIKPEDVIANRLAVEYYEENLTLNASQLAVIAELFEKIENKAEVLKNFEPYQLLLSYILGQKK
jgi:hypothetical protein